MKTLMVIAGGTGGHVYPALAVAGSLLKRGVNVVWLGTRTGLESRVVPANGIDLEWVDVRGLRGAGWFRLFQSPAMLVRALWQAACVIRRRRPDALLGMGGYVAGPGALAAVLMISCSGDSNNTPLPQGKKISEVDVPQFEGSRSNPINVGVNKELGTNPNQAHQISPGLSNQDDVIEKRSKKESDNLIS